MFLSQAEAAPATSGTAPLDHIAYTEEEIGLLSHGSACWLFNTNAAWCAVRLQFLAYRPHMVKKGVLSGLCHRTPVLFAESPDRPAQLETENG